MSGLMPSRVKLRQDVSFLPISGGVLFRNEERVFSLKGESVYRLVSALAPAWGGERTEEEICGLLPDAHRDAARRLMGALVERGVLYRVDAEGGVNLPEAVQVRFRSQIGFIEHMADRPAERFRAFRNSRVAMRGTGAIFRAAAAALVRNGLGEIELDVRASSEDLAVVDAEIEKLQDQGVESKRKMVSGTWDGVSGDCSILVQVSDRPGCDGILGIAQECWSKAVAFIPVFVLEGRIYAGPVALPPEPGCWLCAALRLSAGIAPSAEARLWRSVALDGKDWTPDASQLHAPSAKMAGNAVAFEVFKYAVGHMPLETDRALLVHDIETFENSVQPFLPHPLCRICSSGAAGRGRGHSLREGGLGDARSGEPLPQAWPQSVVGGDLALFGGFEDDENRQLPLNISRLRVAGCSGPGAVGASPNSTQEARLRALRRAVELYSLSAVVDRRTLRRADCKALPGSGAKAVDSPNLSNVAVVSRRPTGTGAQREDYWAVAVSLIDGEAHWVPAGSIFSGCSLNDGSFERTVAGTGSGCTYQAAWQRGLLSALAYEALRHSVATGAEPELLDAAALARADPLLANLLTALARLGRSVAVYRLPGPSPAWTLLASATGNGSAQPVQGLASGLSAEDAARESLTSVLARVQESGASDGKGVDDFLRDVRLPLPEQGGNASATSAQRDAETTFEELLASIRDRPADAVFAETTPPDIAAELSMVAGRVLLVGDAGAFASGG